MRHCRVGPTFATYVREEKGQAMKRLHLFTRFCLMVVVLAGLLVSHDGAAQSLDDAMTSYEQDDFATAIREYRLLAEQGDAKA